MADAVKALTHWRGGRTLVRAEHTREVVKEELPENARKAMLMMAERIDRLEHVIADLAARALRDS
jgi:hypothetical protein